MPSRRSYLSPSVINEGDTVVRTGEVLIHRPSLILPPHIPQLEGFDFEAENSFQEDAMINFLMVRGITLPSMKYDNKISSLNVFEGKMDDAIGVYGNRLQREENNRLIVLKALAQESARQIEVGRFSIELTVGVKQRHQDFEIGDGGLTDGDFCLIVHSTFS